jgi:hypothetical protein
VRVPSSVRRLALLLAVAAALVPAVAEGATGIGALSLRSYVEKTWSLSCSSASPWWDCRDGKFQTWVRFLPETGPVTRLEIRIIASQGLPMDPGYQTMMTDILRAVCAPGNVGAYVAEIAKLTFPGQSTPEVTITGCRLNGGRTILRTYPDHHYVTADVVAPPPTPTPTAAPTPSSSPSPSPTASPTAAPSGGATSPPGTAPTPTPATSQAPGATTGPSAGAGATESPAVGASPSTDPSVEPSTSAAAATPGTGATASPTGPGEGGTTAPTPSPGDAGAGGAVASRPPERSSAAWTHSVSEASGVKADAGTTSVAALAVLFLLFAMGFVGELFNNTLESNYERILSWWKNGPIGRRVRGLRGGLGGPT